MCGSGCLNSIMGALGSRPSNQSCLNARERKAMIGKRLKTMEMTIKVRVRMIMKISKVRKVRKIRKMKTDKLLS